MRDPALSSASFPIAPCKACDKAVLTYVMLDERGDELRLCVHCDAAVNPDLQWANADELEAWGYSFGAPAINKKSGSACGSCNSCATQNKH
jgi:hypothetical protein